MKPHEGASTLRTGYIARERAFALVRRLHRHHKPPQGCILCLGCWADESLIGVAVLGRPVNRHEQASGAWEVTRVCTDGTANACSALYGAARRVARALSVPRLITYTLATETGASLVAAGWIRDAAVEGRDWRSCDRRRKQGALFDEPSVSPTTDKVRWRAW